MAVLALDFYSRGQWFEPRWGLLFLLICSCFLIELFRFNVYIYKYNAFNDKLQYMPKSVIRSLKYQDEYQGTWVKHFILFRIYTGLLIGNKKFARFLNDLQKCLSNQVGSFILRLLSHLANSQPAPSRLVSSRRVSLAAPILAHLLRICIQVTAPGVTVFEIK